MTDSISVTDEAAPSGTSSATSMRIAVLDRDSGFIQVLSKRLDRLGWEHRVLGSPVPTDAVAPMRVSAVVASRGQIGSARSSPPFPYAPLFRSLSKALDRLAWENRVLGSAVPPDAVASMRLIGLVASRR